MLISNYSSEVQGMFTSPSSLCAYFGRNQMSAVDPLGHIVMEYNKWVPSQSIMAIILTETIYPVDISDKNLYC